MKNETNKIEEKTYTVNDIGFILERMEKRFDNTDLKIENLAKETNEKFEKTVSELGSMIEDLDGKVEIIAEGHMSLAKKQDKMLEKQNEMLETQNKMLGMMNGMDLRLNEMDGKVDMLQDDMAEAKFELRQKVSMDQFQRLERRVTKLERLSLSH